MFNTVLPYRLVQRNRTAGRESWYFLAIYKFFMHTPSSRRKYLVEVHAYADHLYTVDFYAKVRDVNRYRLRTNQQAAGKLGGTVLAIMAEVLRQDPQACFGFIAAALVTETSDAKYEALPALYPDAGTENKPAASRSRYKAGAERYFCCSGCAC